jgi:hypothetical protein
MEDQISLNLSRSAPFLDEPPIDLARRDAHHRGDIAKMLVRSAFPEALHPLDEHLFRRRESRPQIGRNLDSPTPADLAPGDPISGEMEIDLEARCRLDDVELGSFRDGSAGAFIVEMKQGLGKLSFQTTDIVERKIHDNVEADGGSRLAESDGNDGAAYGIRDFQILSASTRCLSSSSCVT